MPPATPSPPPTDKRVWIAGDLVPEELDEIGPELTATVPPSWTREEYRALMTRRGVIDTDDPASLGIDGYLTLAEECGVLEKRPRSLWIVGGRFLPVDDTMPLTSTPVLAQAGARDE